MTPDELNRQSAKAESERFNVWVNTARDLMRKAAAGGAYHTSVDSPSHAMDERLAEYFRCQGFWAKNNGRVCEIRWDKPCNAEPWWRRLLRLRSKQLPEARLLSE